MKTVQTLLFFTVLVLIVQASDKELNDRWESFKLRFGKRYSSILEEKRRREVWEESVKFIDEHNRQFEKGLKSFTLSENTFADMDDTEYSGTMLIQKPIEKMDREGGVPHRKFVETTKRNFRKDADLPESIDWRAVGAVSPVKDQGKCGSCYAFAAMGALEGHWKLYSKNRNLPRLSEQEVVDCSLPETNHGCDGGLAYKCYKYVQRNGRVSTSAAYPYEERNATCRAVDNSEATFGASLADYVFTKEQDEEDMKHALATQGPISIHIDSNPKTFKFYNGSIGEGVWDETNCITNASNHAMLAVGYGVTKSGIPYWLIKNSWGEDWGIDGYVRIRRGKNTCAIGWWGGEYPIITAAGSAVIQHSFSVIFLLIFLIYLCAFNFHEFNL